MVVLLETRRDGVTLRRLTPSDAPAYVSLLHSSEAHLTKLGDYLDEMTRPASVYAQQFSDDGPAVTFAIEDLGTTVGSIALVRVDPPKYGLGYWLAEDACGRGLASVAVAAVTDFAFHQLEATDIFAGVSHGNDKSVAVLLRNGFDLAADFENYTRYHLAARNQEDRAD